MTKIRNKESLKAIIYDRKGRVLSIGQNSYEKSHPYQAQCAAAVGLPEKIYVHAEISAIIRCNDLSKAHKIMVYRTGKQGYLNAKPCAICERAIQIAGIKEIWHT